jgi:hypothetical protein
MCMGASARYAAAIFPGYLLLGGLLARLPLWPAFALVALGAGYLAIYSVRFALFNAPYFY